VRTSSPARSSPAPERHATVAAIIGREEPVGRVERFVADIADRTATLVIEGEAGIGKTTVWQVGVDAAARHGYTVLVSRPAQAEMGLAYTGLADLLAGVDDAMFDELPDPQRRALEVALLRAEGGARTPEPRAIFTAFAGVLRALASTGPVLVAVDDRQWLDASTRRALEFVWRRLDDAPVGLLAAERTDSSTAWPPGDDVVRLGPLSAAALHRLIKANTGVSLSRPAVLRAQRVAGGNPFYALELARVLVIAGLPNANAPWPIPGDLRDMVTARVAGLPQPVRRELLTAAASARPTISGLDTPALGPAELAGIVTIDRNGRVRFAHPLYATAIYQSASPDERREVHRHLAAAADDVVERARHRALAAEGADDAVARMLDEAAAAARARGAPDIAAELSERASVLTPAERRRARWRRRVTAAEHHFHAGDLDRAHALLADATGAPPDGTERSGALRLLGETCYRLGTLDDALRLLRQAVDAAAGDPGAAARAELSYMFVLASSFRSFAEADAAARRALRLAERVGDDALLSSALAASAVAAQILGHGLDHARLERALALEDRQESGPLERRPSMLAGYGLLQAEELDGARRILEDLRSRLIARGEDSDLPDLLATLARVECFAGDLEAAREHADRGYELARQSASDAFASQTRGTRALIEAYAGRVDECRAAAADAMDLARRTGWQGAFWATVGLAHLELCLGNDDAVLSGLAASLALVERDGVVDPFRRPFLADAIEALVRLGELERAARMTGLFEERARALGQRAATIAAARCRALVEAAGGDVESALGGLDATLAAVPDVPMPLELARALIVKGQLERRRKHKRQARRSLEDAVGLCERMGATLWAARAHEELARLGRTTDPDALTATEERVARLAASGLTNRDVGAAAFISPKTVEANLSRVYRKLGIRSRAELGARFAAPDDPHG
jgi:DNA-binding CsgD family transcriptional regulator